MERENPVPAGGYVGHIIGSNGETIRLIEKVTGVVIKVPIGQTRTYTLKGQSEESLSLAKDIVDILAIGSRSQDVLYKMNQYIKLGVVLDPSRLREVILNSAAIQPF